MPKEEEINPWTFISSEKIYENPWIRLDEHQVITPGGNPGIYGLISFKNIAVGIVPIDAKGYTWLVGQYRYPLKKYSWEIVEGGGKLDTDPLESAKRELLEETGLVAESWEMLVNLNTSNSVTDEKSVVYIARNLSQRQAEPEDTEQLKIWRLPLQEAVNMALRGEIQDSISLVALLKIGMLGIR